MIRFPVPRTWIPSTPMERPSEDSQTGAQLVEAGATRCSSPLSNLPRRLQDTMGLGLPVAMHSKMAV